MNACCRGKMPIEDALAVTRQVCEALEAAHDAGVVHRDLKPANVMLTSECKAKVLDFGLAKLAGPESGSGASASRSPTMTSAGTQAGMILGTAAYMSPDQARGKPVDGRGDIWALGCLLFEVAAAAVTAWLYFASPEEVRSSAVPARFSFNLRGSQYGPPGNLLRSMDL